jgi:hypothetical protein
MATIYNPTGKTICFKISGMPGTEPKKYEVEPGGEVEIADGYVRSGLYKRFAAGMVAEPPPKSAPKVEMTKPASKISKLVKRRTKKADDGSDG